MLKQFHWRLFMVLRNGQLDQVIPDLIGGEGEQHAARGRVRQLECRAHRQCGNERHIAAFPSHDGGTAIAEHAQQGGQSRSGNQLRHRFTGEAQMINTREGGRADAYRRRTEVVEAGDFILYCETACHQAREIAMREAVWHADSARQISEGRRLTRLDKRKKNLRCLVGRLNPAPSSAIAGSSRWHVVRRLRRRFCDGFFCFCQSRRYSSQKGGEPRIPGARATFEFITGDVTGIQPAPGKQMTRASALRRRSGRMR